MHAAPSVTYPVGRSAFAGRALAALLAIALAACVLWSMQAPWGWRQLAAFAAVLTSGAVGLHGWWRSAAGVLRWDGVDWHWEEGAAVTVGRPVMALDLQSLLLLHWQPEDGTRRWLWLERKSDASHWDALRRAIYSSASTPVPAAGKPPAAEQ